MSPSLTASLLPQSGAIAAEYPRFFHNLDYCHAGELTLGFTEVESVLRNQSRSPDDEGADPRCGGSGFVNCPGR